MKPAVLTPAADNPRARASDPITSDLAAELITALGIEESEREVLVILARADRPLTSEEIIAEHVRRAWTSADIRQYSDSRMRTALKQLRDRGQVIPDGIGQTASGRAAQAYRIAGGAA